MKIMTKNSITALFILLFIMGLGLNLRAADPAELKQFLKKSVMWKCRTINREVPINIYYDGKTTYDEATGTDEAEVIVYVKNKAWYRIGQESDLSILSDYIKKKFIVLT